MTAWVLIVTFLLYIFPTFVDVIPTSGGYFFPIFIVIEYNCNANTLRSQRSIATLL